jgi:YD repeat-containing protein
VSLAPGNGSGWWNLRLRNGLTYVFIQNISYGLSAIRDRFGNQVTIERNNAGYPFLVSSPNGRWIAFSYDSNNRVTVATDSTGRAVTYTYDGYGRMSQVTDARGGVSTYGYANTGGPDGPLWSVTDPDGHAVFINRYDGNGRVLAQWIGQESTPYTFSYAVGTNGLVTQSTMTDPNGNQTVTNMNSSGFPISQTVAAGTSLAETTTYQRQAGTNLITAKTDQLGRTTTFAYDAHGNLSSIVQAGTRKTSISYDPVFSQPTVVTDPALGTTRYAYDSVGELTQVTDPLGNKTTIAYANGDGLATSVTDPLGNTTSYRYTSGDLHTITNPDGSVTSEYLDAGGR